MSTLPDRLVLDWTSQPKALGSEIGVPPAMCGTAAPRPGVRRQEYPSGILSGLSKSRPLTLRNAEYVQVCVQVSGHTATREVHREPPSQACLATRTRATGRRVVGDDRATHRSSAANAHLRWPRRRHVLAGRPAWTPYRLRPKYRSESSYQSAYRISRRLANRSGVCPRRRHERASANPGAKRSLASTVPGRFQGDGHGPSDGTHRP